MVAYTGRRRSDARHRAWFTTLDLLPLATPADGAIAPTPRRCPRPHSAPRCHGTPPPHSLLAGWGVLGVGAWAQQAPAPSEALAAAAATEVPAPPRCASS